jgi:hypothetical protein
VLPTLLIVMLGPCALCAPIPDEELVDRLTDGIARHENCARWNNAGCLVFAGQLGAKQSGTHAYAVFRTETEGRLALKRDIRAKMKHLRMSVRQVVHCFNETYLPALLKETGLKGEWAMGDEFYIAEPLDELEELILAGYGDMMRSEIPKDWRTRGPRINEAPTDPQPNVEKWKKQRERDLVAQVLWNMRMPSVKRSTARRYRAMSHEEKEAALRARIAAGKIPRPKPVQEQSVRRREYLRQVGRKEACG